MISVIGTGTAGINIAEHFSQFPQYSIYKIGDIDPMCENDYRWVPDIIAPEKIEESAPDLRKACKDMDDIILPPATADLLTPLWRYYSSLEKKKFMYFI